MSRKEDGRSPVRPDAVKEEKKGRDLQKKKGLVREVEDLSKKLDREEKIHQVLKSALQSTALPEIPSFLPEKVISLMARELLAELAMVEVEIARLEDGIWELQKKSQVLRSGEDNMDGSIDGAMKGGSGGGEKDAWRSHASQEEDLIGRSRIAPKNSFPPKMTSRPSMAINKGKRLHPNKLSERIVSCLICVFLRLWRISRRAEHVRSSAEAKLVRAPLGFGRRVRTDGSKLSPVVLEPRVMKQQDPYGVFKVDGSLPRDIGRYKNLVICTSNSLDAKAVSACSPLIRKLRVLLNSLQDLDVRLLTHQQKLAFWINIYNAIVMNGFLEHGLPSNPEEVRALRNKVFLNVGGFELNALAIEHFILWQSLDLEDMTGENDKKEVKAVEDSYGLDHQEPNAIFALCCGNKSSPAVRIYTAEHVSTELEKAKLEYLQASVVVITAEKLMIPKLLHRHMNDFAEDLDSLVEWICHQLPASGSLRKSLVARVNGQSGGRAARIVGVLPHEFDLQFLLRT